MKLILLLALHGAHASHKATKNAVDAETTQSLIEAASAGVVKSRGRRAAPPGPPTRVHPRARAARVHI